MATTIYNYFILEEYSHWIQFLSSCLLKISFVCLLTTYDVSLWDCLFGSSDLEYNEETKIVDLKFTNCTVKYQLWGSITSLILSLSCIIANLIYGCKCNDNRLVTMEKEKNNKNKKKILEFVDLAKDIKKIKQLKIN